MACLQQSLLAAGEPAVGPVTTVARVPLDAGSWVDVVRGWVVGADALHGALAQDVPWRQHRRRMYERVVDEPRLTCAYDRAGPLPHPVLRDIAEALDAAYGARFGGLFLNYYRDGHDSVAFHRDRELRESPVGLVAVVTLGAARPFLLRPRAGGPSVDVHPASGDLLVMRGRCHYDWEHGVPKVARAGPRISVSLRTTAAPTGLPTAPTTDQTS